MGLPFLPLPSTLEWMCQGWEWVLLLVRPERRGWRVAGAGAGAGAGASLPSMAPGLRHL